MEREGLRSQVVAVVLLTAAVLLVSHRSCFGRHHKAEPTALVEEVRASESPPSPRSTEARAAPLAVPSSRDLRLRARLRRSGVEKLRRFLGKLFGTGGDWGTCGVVGNSGGALLGKNRGPLIDSHDVVIRLNFAPTSDHELDLGKRTSVAFVNGWKLAACVAASNATESCSSCWGHYQEREGVLVVSYAITEEHARDAEACSRATSPARFHLVSPEYSKFTNSLVHHYTSEKIKRNFPRELWHKLAEERRKVSLEASSGFRAVVLALSLCSEVSLFDFGGGAETEGHQHHYFEGHTKEEIPDHDYEAEMIFYREMESRSAPLASALDVKSTTIH